MRSHHGQARRHQQAPANSSELRLSLGSPEGANATSNRTPPAATAIAPATPASANSRFSASASSIICPREPPNAARSACSPLCPTDRASCRFARFTAPISNTPHDSRKQQQQRPAHFPPVISSQKVPPRRPGEGSACPRPRCSSLFHPALPAPQAIETPGRSRAIAK